MAKRLGKPAIIALGCLFMLGCVFGAVILRYAQYRGESRVIKALRFELRKYGVVKGYNDEDYAIIADNAEYNFVEPALAWAVVEAENARDVALGGVLSPISHEIRMRAAAKEWPHYQLVKGLHYYQLSFIRKYRTSWGKYCEKHKDYKTTQLWHSFFWVYRTRFVEHLAKGWLMAHDNREAWERNVLILWREGR